MSLRELPDCHIGAEMRASASDFDEGTTLVASQGFKARLIDSDATISQLLQQFPKQAGYCLLFTVSNDANTSSSAHHISIVRVLPTGVRGKTP
jgi:hypothetical protein